MVVYTEEELIEHQEKAEANGILAERARCADIARTYARALSKGSHPRTGSIEEIGERIATEILNQ